LLALLAPVELAAQRGARGGGGARASVSSGSSVRQARVQANSGASVNRAAVSHSTAGAYRGTGSAANVDRTRTVDAARNANVHDRDWDRGDVESIHVGDENVYIRGEEHRVWVGESGVHTYETHEGLRVAAGVATGIAIGAMIASPPLSASGIVVDGVGYYYDDGLYYQEVYAEGEVAYQVIEPPIGAVVEELPAGCTDYVLEGVNYKNCGGIYYEPDGLSWKVVHL
jgi:hypothetical protein